MSLGLRMNIIKTSGNFVLLVEVWGRSLFDDFVGRKRVLSRVLYGLESCTVQWCGTIRSYLFCCYWPWSFGDVFEEEDLKKEIIFVESILWVNIRFVVYIKSIFVSCRVSPHMNTKHCSPPYEYNPQYYIRYAPFLIPRNHPTFLVFFFLSEQRYERSRGRKVLKGSVLSVSRQ